MARIKRITLENLYVLMRDFNTAHPELNETPVKSAIIVYKQSNFKIQYSLRDHSYRVFNSNRAFQKGKISNSLFGDCLDQKDIGVRLDLTGWEVEYCYIETIPPDEVRR